MSDRLRDAAKRVADQYALHKVGLGDGAIGKWFAAKLSDGTSDGVAYDSKQAAIDHQHHNEFYYAYVQIGPWTMTEQEAKDFLALHRRMYSAGIRLMDPGEAGRDVIPRLTRRDQSRQTRAMLIGDKPPTNIRYNYN